MLHVENAVNAVKNLVNDGGVYTFISVQFGNTLQISVVRKRRNNCQSDRHNDVVKVIIEAFGDASFIWKGKK